MEGQKELIVSSSQALCTAASSRKSWQGERKERLIKLSNVLIRQAVGSDSGGRRFNCRRIRGMGSYTPNFLAHFPSHLVDLKVTMRP